MTLGLRGHLLRTLIWFSAQMLLWSGWNRFSWAAPFSSTMPSLEPSSPKLPETSISAHTKLQEASLSLKQVVDSVEKHYPLIQVAQQEQQMAKAEVLAAKGAFDPQVRFQAEGAALGYYQNGRFEARYTQPTPFWGAQFFGGYRLGLGTFPVYEGKLETNQYGEVFAGVEVPLWRNGPIDRRRADMKKAEVGTSMAKASLDQQRIESTRLASNRYWDWVSAGQRLRIAKELLDLAEKRNQWLRRRVEEGDLSKIEQIDNERLVLQRQGFVAASERQLEQAQIELSLYLRDEQGNPILADASLLPKEFPAPGPPLKQDLEKDLVSAFATRPELKRLQFQKEQFQIERAWAKNQMMPLFSLYTGISQDLGPGDLVRAPFVLEVGLKIELPLLNRYAKGKFQAADAGMVRSEAQLRLMKDQIKAEVLSAQSILRIAQKRIELNQEEVSVAKQTQEGEWKKFRMGDSNLVFVNLREQFTAEAELRLVDSQLEYFKGQAAYTAALSGQ